MRLHTSISTPRGLHDPHARTNFARVGVNWGSASLDNSNLMAVQDTSCKSGWKVTIFFGSSAGSSAASSSCSSSTSSFFFGAVLAFLLAGLDFGVSSSLSESARPLFDLGLDLGFAAALGAGAAIGAGAAVEGGLFLELDLVGTAVAPSVAAFLRGGMLIFECQGKVV